jgi:hypothetical protein
LSRRRMPASWLGHAPARNCCFCFQSPTLALRRMRSPPRSSAFGLELMHCWMICCGGCTVPTVRHRLQPVVTIWMGQLGQPVQAEDALRSLQVVACSGPPSSASQTLCLPGCVHLRCAVQRPSQPVLLVLFLLRAFPLFPSDLCCF